MKFNLFRSSFIFLCKSIMISLLVMICCSLPSHAVNIDSLKIVLKTSDNHEDACSIVLEIYKHYDAIGKVDSMNVYANHIITICDLNKKEVFAGIELLIREQYKQGSSNNINPLIDSFLTVIQDPDLKLKFLVDISDMSFFYETEDQFDKYWRKAQEALKHVKEDDSRFVYYNFLGFKNRAEDNLFAAIQSFKLAATFTEVNIKALLKNNYDLAFIYLKTGEAEKAKEIFLDLLEKAEENSLPLFVIYIYYGLLDCYSYTEDFDEVIRLSHESINYSIKYNLKTPLGYSYSKLGESHLALSNLDSARYYIDKGVEYSLENNESKELGDNYFVLSDYYKAIGNRKKARLYLTKAQNEKSYYENSEIDKKFAELWAADNNYRKAYFHLNKYTTDRLKKEDIRKNDITLATKFIEDYYKYKEESEANLLMSKQKEERLRNVIILTLAGLILAAILLMYVQRNRKKLEVLNNQIIQRNKELDILINKQNETIKYLDNFASVAAHDLKAPIRTASAFAGLLTKIAGHKLIEKEMKFLNYIGSSVAQLSGMIDDLLSLSRLDADLPEAKQVDLNEIVLQVESLLSNLLKNTDSKIVVDSTLPKVKGHSTLISQLLQNIIKNSIVHNKTGNNTIIKIRSESKNNGMYTIKISDNSGGIPDYIIPKMFDLFSSSDKKTGNGIGLATCKKIVNHYGGEIWVDVIPSVGSTFNFNLFD